MSRLKEGVHEVRVIPRKAVSDGYGGTRYEDLPEVTVRGNAHPQSATEQETMGLQGQVTYSFTTFEDWPWAMVSKVKWDGPNGRWPGRTWDQVGEARVYSMSSGTAHCSVVLQARTSKNGE